MDQIDPHFLIYGAFCNFSKVLGFFCLESYNFFLGIILKE